MGTGADRAAGRPASELPLDLPRALRRRLTPQEARLWVALRELRDVGFHFRRQVAVGRFVIDFGCLKHRLLIEVDGGQHGDPRHAERDEDRDRVLEQQGFRMIRFWNGEVNRNFAGVMETILAALDAGCPHPGPPLRSGSALPSGEGGARALGTSRTGDPT